MLALLAAAAGTHAHGLVAANAVVPDQAECPEGQLRCLETIDAQPVLEGGEHVDLVAWNDDDEAHRILVTANSSADPTHEDTPAEVALAATDRLEPGTSQTAGEFVVPSDAEALYLWCDEPGHEAEGAWMRLAVDPDEQEASETPLGSGWLLVALAGALAVLRAGGQGWGRL